MDESFGAQYALQIALQTVRERCQQFQQRIACLEEENIKLRSKNEVNCDKKDSSLSEIDTLKRQVALLTEQKLQLRENVVMISAENRRLWSRLSKLTQVNENLGSKLHQINDTLSQHNTSSPQNAHVTLIRSKTFTQDEPHLKFLPKNVTDENDKISLELEDISLKLISTIAKEKSELELQCSQMTEIQNSDAAFINSFAFAYPSEEVEGVALEEFDEQLTRLKNIKDVLAQQKNTLQNSLNNLETVRVETNWKEAANRAVSISVQTVWKTDAEKPEVDETENSAIWDEVSSAFVGSKASSISNKPTATNRDYICPICSKIFYSNSKFSDFQNHVESHFVAENDGINNFEVIP